MTTKLKYNIGQKVSYVIAGNELFAGIIIGAEIKRSLKPYTIKDSSGNIRYANEMYLIPSNQL